MQRCDEHQSHFSQQRHEVPDHDHLGHRLDSRFTDLSGSVPAKALTTNANAAPPTDVGYDRGHPDGRSLPVAESLSGLERFDGLKQGNTHTGVFDDRPKSHESPAGCLADESVQHHEHRDGRRDHAGWRLLPRTQEP